MLFVLFQELSWWVLLKPEGLVGVPSLFVCTYFLCGSSFVSFLLFFVSMFMFYDQRMGWFEICYSCDSPFGL